MKLINGKLLAEAILNEAKNEINNTTLQPRLDIVFVGDNSASAVYVNKKIEAGRSIGVNVVLHHFETATNTEVCELVKELAENPQVNGIILQLPAPGINTEEVFALIPLNKDVDGLNPGSLGLLWHDTPVLVPATPAAIMFELELIAREDGMLLADYLEAKQVLMISRSLIIGKPLAALLAARNATVTIAHSKTKDLKTLMSQADIIISGAGVPGLVSAEHIKDGAVVIDAGFKKTQEGTSGDIGNNDLSAKAAWVSPVPHGIGPLGVAFLINNTVKAALLQKQ